MHKLIVVILACLGFAEISNGHSMPGSLVNLEFHRDQIDAELILPLQELELSFKKPMLADPASAISTQESELRAYIKEHINPTTVDGIPWNVEVTALRGQLSEQPFDLIAQVSMTPPPGATTRKFRFNYSVINHEVMSHHATIAVRSDWDTSVFASRPEPLGVLQYVVTYIDIDRTQGSWTKGFNSVFHHGMYHISDGTDHLLFLLVLLLPAPLIVNGKRWNGPLPVKSAIIKLMKIVTAFTIGHSLTLAVAGFGWVRLPSQPVEILIAVSILISAIHAIRPIFPGREAYIAAGFGLIHGLAFANSIAEYGFSTYYIILTVLAFNLGIETMQLFVVACVVPWLLLFSRSKAYCWPRWLGAGFAALAALGWTLNRAWGMDNPIDSMVASIAKHSWAVVVTLAVLSSIAFLNRPKSQLAIPNSLAKVPPTRNPQNPKSATRGVKKKR